MIAAAMIVAGDDETRSRIEDQRPRVGRTGEIEHGEDRAGDAVERPLAVRQRRRIDEAELPIVLDENEARGLVGRAVIDLESDSLGLNRV